MRIAEAKKILSGTLKFGDANQIRALEVLRKSAEMDDPIKCAKCDGTGEVNCPICCDVDEDCSTCHGEIVTDCPDCDGRGNIEADKYDF